MKLRLTVVADRRAVFSIDGDPDQTVTVRAAEAVAIARKIARAVDRDPLFDALVAALTPFHSGEMGNLLLDAMFFVDGLDPEADTDPVKREAEKRMRKLIGAVDLILKAVAIKARGDG